MLTRRISDAVAELSLDRPAVRNALDAALTDQLIEALEDISVDSAVRAVLIRGEGAGFCSGSDVKEMSRVSDARRLDIARTKASLMQRIAELDRPVVAAVHGFALGGGFMLAVGCDIVVCSDDSRWRLPEVALGFFPPWGLDGLCARMAPAQARRLLWGVEPLDGRDAVRLGLAEHCVAADQVLSTARDLATRLAALPPESASEVKRFVRSSFAAAGGLDARACEVYRRNCEGAPARTSFAKRRS